LKSMPRLPELKKIQNAFISVRLSIGYSPMFLLV
jgi:hypothetical protein